jgi:hypothetical protein
MDKSMFFAECQMLMLKVERISEMKGEEIR